MWFDVEKKNYTTNAISYRRTAELWFDVEKKNYTTMLNRIAVSGGLWFDVEKKNYTTANDIDKIYQGCGLM